MLGTLILAVVAAFVVLVAITILRGVARATELNNQSSIYPKFERHLRAKGPYFDQGMVLNKETNRIEPQSKVSATGACST